MNEPVGFKELDETINKWIWITNIWESMSNDEILKLSQIDIDGDPLFEHFAKKYASDLYFWDNFAMLKHQEFLDSISAFFGKDYLVLLHFEDRFKRDWEKKVAKSIAKEQSIDDLFGGRGVFASRKLPGVDPQTSERGVYHLVKYLFDTDIRGGQDIAKAIPRIEHFEISNYSTFLKLIPVELKSEARDKIYRITSKREGRFSEFSNIFSQMYKKNPDDLFELFKQMFFYVPPVQNLGRVWDEPDREVITDFSYFQEIYRNRNQKTHFDGFMRTWQHNVDFYDVNAMSGLMRDITENSDQFANLSVQYGYPTLGFFVPEDAKEDTDALEIRHSTFFFKSFDEEDMVYVNKLVGETDAIYSIYDQFRNSFNSWHTGVDVPVLESAIGGIEDSFTTIDDNGRAVYGFIFNEEFYLVQLSEVEKDTEILQTIITALDNGYTMNGDVSLEACPFGYYPSSISFYRSMDASSLSSIMSYGGNNQLVFPFDPSYPELDSHGYGFEYSFILSDLGKRLSFNFTLGEPWDKYHDLKVNVMGGGEIQGRTDQSQWVAEIGPRKHKQVYKEERAGEIDTLVGSPMSIMLRAQNIKEGLFDFFERARLAILPSFLDESEEHREIFIEGDFDGYSHLRRFQLIADNYQDHINTFYRKGKEWVRIPAEERKNLEILQNQIMGHIPAYIGASDHTNIGIRMDDLDRMIGYARGATEELKPNYKLRLTKAIASSVVYAREEGFRRACDKVLENTESPALVAATLNLLVENDVDFVSNPLENQERFDFVIESRRGRGKVYLMDFGESSRKTFRNDYETRFREELSRMYSEFSFDTLFLDLLEESARGVEFKLGYS